MIRKVRMVRVSTHQEKNPEVYIESETPQSEQKYKGWYWSYPEKKFYRWDNQPCMVDENDD